MVVYVMNKNGQPLMPTTRFGKVRRLLNKNLAKVIKRCPFTIQLLYEATDFVQPITLGVDAGSKTVGTSATEYFIDSVPLISHSMPPVAH